MEYFLPFLAVKKLALICLIIPITGGLFKVKPMSVWLVSTMSFLLILLKALTCSEGDVRANFIVSR